MASLFVSYGENLQQANLPSSFSVENIRTVSSSCPNLKFAAYVHTQSALSAPFIDALSNHVVELFVELHEGHFTPKQAQEIFPDAQCFAS